MLSASLNKTFPCFLPCSFVGRQGGWGDGHWRITKNKTVGRIAGVCGRISGVYGRITGVCGRRGARGLTPVPTAMQ